MGGNISSLVLSFDGLRSASLCPLVGGELADFISSAAISGDVAADLEGALRLVLAISVDPRLNESYVVRTIFRFSTAGADQQYRRECKYCYFSKH
jgi:hypothetical protein